MEESAYQDFWTELFSWFTPKENSNCIKVLKKTIPMIVRQLCSGKEHTVIITNEGSIYTFGSNQYGQLGIDDESISISEKTLFIKQLANLNCIRIAAGLNFSLALMDDGTLWGWGESKYACLGAEKIQNCFQPVLIPTSMLGRITNLVCGHYFSVLINEDSQIYISGQNIFGFPDQEYLTQKQLEITQTIQDIAAGCDHFILQTVQNEIIVVDKRKNYNPINFQFPILQIFGGQITAILNDKNELFYIEKEELVKLPLKENMGVIECGFGQKQACILDDEKRVWEYSLQTKQMTQIEDIGTEIRNIVAGDQNFVVVGQILRHSKGIMKAMRSSASEKDNICLNPSEKQFDEVFTMSPLGGDQPRISRNSSIIQSQHENTTFSFSMKRDIIGKNENRKSQGSDNRLSSDNFVCEEKETQTEHLNTSLEVKSLYSKIKQLEAEVVSLKDDRERVQVLTKENQALKQKIAQCNLSMETQFQYQGTQKEQIRRLTEENTQLKIALGQNRDMVSKEEILNQIITRQNKIKQIISQYNTDHNKIMNSLSNN